MSSTILLSYPRSGSTWVRYIVEALSGRPTSNGGNPYSSEWANIKHPIYTIHQDADPILYKYHFATEIPSKDDRRLILLLRDYHEVIFTFLKSDRRNPASVSDFVRSVDMSEIPKHFCDYIGNIVQFICWPVKESKKIIYYEDLIVAPIDTVREIAKFLEIPQPDAVTIRFMSQYHMHRENCLLYKDSPSNMPCNTRGDIDKIDLFKSCMTSDQLEQFALLANEYVSTTAIGTGILRAIRRYRA